MKKLIIILTWMLMTPLFSCTDEFSRTKKPDGSLRIWAHSDLHLKTAIDWNIYKRDMMDIVTSASGIDAAIVAGDIGLNKKNSGFYCDMKSLSGIRYWFELAGNHDAENIQRYSAITKKPLHYSVSIGNLLIIFMSDEKMTHETDIPDDVFNWWKRLVEKNRDKILVTVTHGVLKGNGTPASLFSEMCIAGSDRFTGVLQKFPVDIWIHGHTHYPFFLKGRIFDGAINGVIFLDISSIRSKLFFPSTSYLIEFREGSGRVLVIPRVHFLKSWFAGTGSIYEMKKNFSWKGENPVIVPYKKSGTTPQMKLIH
ncbi:MAG: metallophosphoesterase [Spirochaetes bacterium]|jgi:predicted phosphodiesterase|nr:metallophosphoesterase [Spirochaetota bacterium]